MDYDAFIEAAWSDHADRPAEVAERLAASRAIVDAPARVPPYARLVTHVLGEHLGEWERGARMLEALRVGASYDGSAAVEGAIARGIGTLRYAEGASGSLASLSREDRIAAMATASSALVARGERARGIAAYEDAVALAAESLPEGSPAIRALAAGGNNLAVALEDRAGRSADETRAMVGAAECALRYWKVAGRWLEHERAHYRLAKSLLAAGRPAEAVEHAKACVDVCERHDAPAFERFFADAALALALRTAGDASGAAAARERALRRLDDVAADERPFCEADRAALEAT